MDSTHITQDSGLEGMLGEMGIRFVLSVTVSVSVTLEYLLWRYWYRPRTKTLKLILLIGSRVAFKLSVFHLETQSILAEGPERRSFPAATSSFRYSLFCTVECCNNDGLSLLYYQKIQYCISKRGRSMNGVTYRFKLCITLAEKV